MKKIYTIFVCICLLAGFVACEKDKDFVLTTLMVQNETITPSYGSATIDCSFKADATISEAFVQFSLSSSFAKYDVAKMTKEKGKYAALLLDLQDNTTYYIRYAVSNKYSSVVSEDVIEFQTLQCTVPTIVLDSIVDVWDNRAKAYLHLAFDGGASVTDMGICWSKQANPTIEAIHKSTKDTVTVLDMTDLQENMQYYVRAYAVNKVGVSYSEEKTFTTSNEIVLPTVTTATVTQITETTAVAGGNVTSDGGAEITERGVVYATTQNPTTNNIKVKSGTGTGSFTCNLTGLQQNTTYYVRAYAINEKGTAYGEEVTFITNKQIVLPSVTTATVTQITETTVVAGGNVMSDGGASVTERGVVYATTQNPTTADNKVSNGSGMGTFTCNLTSLQANTTYYVRAYAVNSMGTAYGEEVSFTTKEQSSTPSNGTENGYEYVDLGLSVKWATMNVGASKAEEEGDRFAWGEIEPKKVYDWSTYKWCNGNDTTLTKYNTDNHYGIIDNKTILELENDAAHAHWGGNWRMPTDAEWAELLEQCTWEYTYIGVPPNSICGYTVTCKWNGNSIFLRSLGFYWSSLLYTDNSTKALSLHLESGGFYECNFPINRSYGLPIRPVLGEYVPEITLPVVTTNVVTQITETSAVAGGNVTSNASVTERGVCIATVSNPTTSNIKITAGSGTGSFTCNLTGLQENTTYYIRAYAVNSMGTAYGEEVSFTTAVIGMPTVTTTQPSSITETTAVTGGNVTADGGASVTERGVVYSLSANPSISDLSSTIVRSGNGTGAFTCNLSNLQAGTTYYVRAYAINSKGTVYGDEISFTTALPITLATVTTASITQITETSAVAGGNVTSDGGANVMERGVVYSTNPNPVITNLNNTIRPCGSGTGAFAYNMTGLQSGTTYYVRAYATNEVGTAYGEEVSFTTKEQSSTPNNGTENGYAYVDLGLSVKWATCNVGASKPEDYGDYYAWGETTTKTEYNWSTYKYCYTYYNNLTKYNTYSSYGTVDNKTTLELGDDAARAKLGGAWRLPTEAEFLELREQCTWTWTTQNGVNGYKVTSKSNGNNIFLPAAGYRTDSKLNVVGSDGCYWANSIGSNLPYCAWRLDFNASEVKWNGDNRYYGQSVRPVCP